ncbi:MAG: hypothetical protein AAF676_07580 [Pseudomonadota bacterium]
MGEGVGAAKRALAAALTELQAAVEDRLAVQASDSAGKIREVEGELEALRKARAEDAEMIEAALSELKEAV